MGAPGKQRNLAISSREQVDQRGRPVLPDRIVTCAWREQQVAVLGGEKQQEQCPPRASHAKHRSGSRVHFGFLHLNRPAL